MFFRGISRSTDHFYRVRNHICAISNPFRVCGHSDTSVQVLCKAIRHISTAVRTPNTQLSARAIAAIVSLLLDVFGPPVGPLKPSAWQSEMFIAPSAFSLTRTYRCAFMPCSACLGILRLVCAQSCASFWQASLVVSTPVGMYR